LAEPKFTREEIEEEIKLLEQEDYVKAPEIIEQLLKENDELKAMLKEAKEVIREVEEKHNKIYLISS
jgi:hypothetical protein